jgi:hypothetical protein
MTRLHPRLLAASGGPGWRTLGAMLAAAALGGCGPPGSGDVNQAVGDAARAAQAVTQLSQKAVRSWCPAAVAGDGRQLTQAQARDCLRRAWNGWLGELKRNGYDARAIAQGK